MSEKKPKIPLTGQVRLPEELDRAIDMESVELGVFKYEVVARAWAAYTQKGSPALPNSDDSKPPVSGERSIGEFGDQTTPKDNDENISVKSKKTARTEES